MRIDNFKSKYINGTVHLHRAEYSNGRTALRLFSDDGEPLCVATVNMPDYTIDADDEVMLKGWSENEGVPDALIAAGVIGPAIRSIPTGFVEATVHKLLMKVNGA